MFQNSYYELQHEVRADRAFGDGAYGDPLNYQLKKSAQLAREQSKKVRLNQEETVKQVTEAFKKFQNKETKGGESAEGNCSDEISNFLQETYGLTTESLKMLQVKIDEKNKEEGANLREVVRGLKDFHFKLSAKELTVLFKYAGKKEDPDHVELMRVPLTGSVELSTFINDNEILTLAQITVIFFVNNYFKKVSKDDVEKIKESYTVVDFTKFAEKRTEGEKNGVENMISEIDFLQALKDKQQSLNSTATIFETLNVNLLEEGKYFMNEMKKKFKQLKLDAKRIENDILSMLNNGAHAAYYQRVFDNWVSSDYLPLVLDEIPFKYKSENDTLETITVDQHQTILIHMIYYIYSFDSTFVQVNTMWENMKTNIKQKNFDSMKVAYDNKVKELSEAGTIMGYNWYKYDNNFKNNTEYLGEILDTYEFVNAAFTQDLEEEQLLQLNKFVMPFLDTLTKNKERLTKLLKDQKMDQFSIFFFGNSEKVEKLDKDILPKPLLLRSDEDKSEYKAWLDKEAEKILPKNK